MSHHYFYGKAVNRNFEQEYIQKLLEKYRKEPVTDELKKMVWDELMYQKHLGNITIPFKLALRKDPSGQYPESLEVILDTRV